MQSHFRPVCGCILTILWIFDMMEAVYRFFRVGKLTVFRHFLFSSLWTLFFAWLLVTFVDKLGAGARLGQTLHTPTLIPPPVLEQICDADRRKINAYEDAESVTPRAPLRSHCHQPTYARGAGVMRYGPRSKPIRRHEWPMRIRERPFSTYARDTRIMAEASSAPTTHLASLNSTIS